MIKAFNKYKIFDRYFCNNCGHWFRTGCFTKEEENDPECKELYDDICPYCVALTFEWYQCFGYLLCRLSNKSAHKKSMEKSYKKFKAQT